MLKWRALSFPLLLALLAAVFFAPGWTGRVLFAVCGCAAITLATCECARMLKGSGTENFVWLSGICALVISLIPATYIVSGWNFAISIMHTALALWILMLFLIPWLLILLMRGKAAKAVFTSIGIGTVVPLPFAAAMLLYTRGPMFMLFVICATKAMDTGGYIFGMLSNRMMKNGNHKLCPTVSPKKSWEGAAGGMLLSIAVGWCFFKCVGMLPLWWYVAFSAALAAASIMGDLTESALKRGCGVKDSGSWIPGMGGALDVLDSFIYTAMVSVVFTMLIK